MLNIIMLIDACFAYQMWGTDRHNLIAYDVLLAQVTIFNNNHRFLFEKLTIKVTKLREKREKKKYSWKCCGNWTIDEDCCGQ
jgi:hypothetical protein